MSKCVSPLRQSVQREEVENSSTHVSAVFAVSELTCVACFGKLRKALAQRFRQCAARGGIGDGNAERRAVRMREKNDLEVDATLFLDSPQYFIYP